MAVQINRNNLTKGFCGPFGMEPAKALAFISVLMFLNADALAGIAMPATASASNSLNILMNAGALWTLTQKAGRAFWMLVANSLPGQIVPQHQPIHA